MVNALVNTRAEIKANTEKRSKPFSQNLESQKYINTQAKNDGSAENPAALPTNLS